MTAFDTDVLSEILLGNAEFVARASAIPEHGQAVPIIVIEEIMCNRLHVIRQAEAGKSKISIERAYELFQETIRDVQRVEVLSYTSQVEFFYRQCRQQNIRVSTHDLRIAAICVAHGARLISRNRRDFERLPGLTVEFWD